MSQKYQHCQWFLSSSKVALYCRSQMIESLLTKRSTLASVIRLPLIGLLCASSVFLQLIVPSITKFPASKLLAESVSSEDLEAASLYQQGVMRYYHSDSRAAEYAFRQALQRDPNIGLARNYLGNIMLQQNRLNAAVQEYGEAIRINPNIVEAYYNLGLALHKQGQKEAAITAYRQALIIDPTMASAQYNLGLALYEQGQKEEAIAAYQHAITLDSSNANAYFNLAIAQQEQGRIPEAITTYHKYIQLDPKNPIAYNNLGSLLSIQGQAPKAIATYLEATRRIPNDVTAYYNLGVIWYKQGDFKKANLALKHASNQYREQGDIQLAEKADQVMQKIAQLALPFPPQNLTSNAAQPMPKMPNQPEARAETQGYPILVPVSVERQLPPQEMPILPPTPLQPPK
ncbi:MAG: tetratricopeptide repeat protein [Rhizonema sp. NSF051]|nr:tetratricopeptide repeat protein [Rhizonema sp. NSF051]